MCQTPCASKTLENLSLDCLDDSLAYLKKIRAKTFYQVSTDKNAVKKIEIFDRSIQMLKLERERRFLFLRDFYPCAC